VTKVTVVGSVTVMTLELALIVSRGKLKN